MKSLFMMASLAALVFFAIRHIVRRKRAVDDAWAEVARANDLRLAPGGAFSHPSMSGIHDGFRVSIDVVTHGSGNSSQTNTRYRVHYSRLGNGIRLTREVPVLSTIGKMFGGEDHEVGDPDFDDKVIVRAPDEAKARAYLTAPRRRAIEKFLSSHKRAVITERNATFETPGIETRASGMERGLRLLVDLARELEQDESAGDAAPRPAVAPLAELEPLDFALPEPAPAVDAAKTAAAGLAAALGAVVASKETVEEPAQEPPPVEVGSVAPPTDTAPAPEPEPFDAGVEAPPMPEVGSIAPDARPPDDAPEESAPTTVRQQEVCEALFAETGGLSGTRDVFEEHYDGLFVHWTGELRSARHYYSDLVFGSDPGTRLEMVVAKVASGILGEREIIAVVQLPDGVDAELSGRTGETVTIEGDLASVDPFMRQVFVRNGSIVS